MLQTYALAYLEPWMFIGLKILCYSEKVIVVIDTASSGSIVLYNYILKCVDINFNILCYSNYYTIAIIIIIIIVYTIAI